MGGKEAGTLAVEALVQYGAPALTAGQALAVDAAVGVAEARRVALVRRYGRLRRGNRGRARIVVDDLGRNRGLLGLGFRLVLLVMAALLLLGVLTLLRVENTTVTVVIEEGLFVVQRPEDIVVFAGLSCQKGVRPGEHGNAEYEYGVLSSDGLCRLWSRGVGLLALFPPRPVHAVADVPSRLLDVDASPDFGGHGDRLPPCPIYRADTILLQPVILLGSPLS